MTDSVERTKRRRIPRVATIALGVVLYTCILWLVGFENIRHALGITPWPVLGAIALLECSGLAVRALKWRIALTGSASPTRLFFVSRAAGIFTPGRLGEFAPVLIPKYRTPQLGAWLAMDRIFEAGATLLLGAFGLIMLGAGNHSGLVAALAVVAAGVAIGMFFLFRPNLYASAESCVIAYPRVAAVVRFLHAASTEAVALRWRTPILFALSLLATIIDLAQGLILFRGYGYAVSVPLFAVAQCAHALASVVPIASTATGVPYLASGAILNHYAAIPAGVLATGLAIHFALTQGVFWALFAIVMGRTRAT